MEEADEEMRRQGDENMPSSYDKYDLKKLIIRLHKYNGLMSIAADGQTPRFASSLKA